MRAALQVRVDALRSVLADIRHAPFSYLFSAAVVAMALGLPAALFGTVGAVGHLVRGWDRGEQMSVYLHRATSPSDQQALAARLKRQPDIAQIVYISPAAGLRELVAAGHFGNALALLPRNPLPPVLVLTPAPDVTPAEFATLTHTLEADPLVASVQADLTWAERLAAGIAIARRAGIVLATGFAVAIMVIIGNSARLQVLARKDEIELMMLVGAKNSFVRRPFVYAGAVAGLAGGVMGWFILLLGVGLLQGPVARLAQLYQSQFQLTGPGPAGGGALMLTGLLLGALGARLAVGRQLREFTP